MRLSRATTIGLIGFGVCIVMAAFLVGKQANAPLQFELRTKPVQLLAHRMLAGQAHYDHAVWIEGEFTAPEDMWISGFWAELEGAPVEKLHNFFLYRKDVQDIWCPNNFEAVWAGSTVSSKVATEFPLPYGVHVRKGETLIARAMLTNLADEQATEYKRVYLVVHGTYQRADKSARTRDTKLYLIGPHACDSGYPIFSLQPHSKDRVYSTKDRPLVFNEDGEIIRARGHYHGSYDRGIVNTLRFFMNGTLIDEVSSSNIGDDSARNPQLLRSKVPLVIFKGDSVSMEAVLSNPSEEIVPEGMAIIGLFFSAKN